MTLRISRTKKADSWSPCVPVLFTYHRQGRCGESKNEVWGKCEQTGDFSWEGNYFALSLKIPIPQRRSQRVWPTQSPQGTKQHQDGRLSLYVFWAGRWAYQAPGMMYTVNHLLCFLSLPWCNSPWGKFLLNADDLSEDLTNQRKLSRANSVTRWPRRKPYIKQLPDLNSKEWSRKVRPREHGQSEYRQWEAGGREGRGPDERWIPCGSSSLSS